MQLVDFAVVCALDVEFNALSRCFSNGRPGMFTGRDCIFTRFINSKSNKSYRLIIVKIGEMGNLASLSVCIDLIREFSPRHIILAGICGGLLKSVEDFRLGDVVVSDRVIYYEPAKLAGLTYEERPRTYESKSDPSKRLLKTALGIKDGSWTASQRIKVERPHDSNARERPRLMEGVVCSGEKVIASEIKAEELRSSHPHAVSIEMEAAGVAYACRIPDMDFIVVKGVSDSAGSEKNDEYRQYACATAASFIHCLLTEAELPELTPRRQFTVPLGDLFRLRPGGEVKVILPSYDNPRHKNDQVLNYPYNPFESAFDDIYCAFRIRFALESLCGRDNVHYHFDQEQNIPEAPNKILIGSTVSNMYTHTVLHTLHFQFDTGERDHDIFAPTDKDNTRFAASYHETLHGPGFKALDTDYALISVAQQGSQSAVVLAGCRAYGQMLLGDFLSNAEQTDKLVNLVPQGDFQCILKVEVEGRHYKFGGIEKVVFRGKDNVWRDVII